MDPEERERARLRGMQQLFLANWGYCDVSLLSEKPLDFVRPEADADAPKGDLYTIDLSEVKDDGSDQ